jgi:hypothetical protein
MSNMAADGFKYVYSLNTRSMKYQRPGGTEVTLKILPSNYVKNQSAVDDVVVPERQFIVSIEEMAKTVEKMPKRGDRLTDDVLGANMVEKITPLIIFGEIVGYRLDMK